MVHVPGKVVFFYRFAMLLLLDAARAPRGLAYLEIRSRNEEAIYLLKVFYILLYRRQAFFRMFTFYLFLNWFSTRVCDDRKYYTPVIAGYTRV